MNLASQLLNTALTDSRSNEPLMRRGPLTEVGDRGLIEHGAFRQSDVFPDRREDLRRGLVRFSGRLTGAVDRDQNLAQRDLARRSSQPVTSRSPSGTVHEPCPLELQEDLDQVTFGNPVGFGDLANPDGRIIRPRPSQRQDRQTGVLCLRGDLHALLGASIKQKSKTNPPLKSTRLGWTQGSQRFPDETGTPTVNLYQYYRLMRASAIRFLSGTANALVSASIYPTKLVRTSLSTN